MTSRCGGPSGTVSHPRLDDHCRRGRGSQEERRARDRVAVEADRGVVAEERRDEGVDAGSSEPGMTALPYLISSTTGPTSDTSAENCGAGAVRRSRART